MKLREVRNELAITKYMFAKATNAKIPLSGTFELTPLCNLSCRMCYVRKSREEVEASVRPMMDCEQWISLAQELRKKGMLYLLLTGGEPFLWPDFWKLYVELNKMGFLISINSNGTLIDSEVVERLKENPPTRINITLYGASNETYEKLCQKKEMFDKVDKAISDLKNAGISVKINCSLTPLNVHDLEQIVCYAKEKDLILEVATYMFPPIRRNASCIGQNERFTPYEAAFYNLQRYRLIYGEEQYCEYLEKVVKGIASPPGLDESCIDPMDGKVRCRAGKASFWITWDGWLTPCGMMNEPKFDITKKTFTENWENLIDESSSLTLSGVCNKCSNQKLCHSCAAVAAAETGKVSGIPQYLCEEMEAARKLAEEEQKKVEIIKYG